MNASGHDARRRTLRRSAILFINSILAAGLGGLFWIAAARAHESSVVGVVGAVMALVPFLGMLAACGLPELVVRFLPTTSAQRSLVQRAIVFAASVAALAAAVWLTVGRSAAPLAAIDVRVPVALAVVGFVVAFAAGLVSTAGLIAAGRPAWVLVETTVGGVLRLVLLAAFRDLGAPGLLGAVALSTVASTLTSAVTLLTLAPISDTGTFRPSRRHRAFAASNAVSAAVSAAPRALVATFVLWRLGPDAAGHAAVPFTLLGFLTLAASMTARSVFTEASAGTADHRLLRTAAGWMFLASTAVALPAAILAPQVLGVFGPVYAAESATLFRLLCLAAVVAVPNYLADVVLNVRTDNVGYTATNVLGVVWITSATYVAAPHGLAWVGVAWVAGQLAYGATGWSIVAVRATHTGRPIQ